MMGANHAATGAAAWIAVTSTAPFALGLHPVSSVGVMTGAVVCAGAAVLPDADHHNGTFAHSLPPVSEWVSDAVEAVSGGHRNGTHSFLGIAVFTALAWAAGLLTIQTESFGTVYVGGGVLAVLLIALALKALRLTRRGRLAPWLTSLTVAALVALFAPEEWNWLPVAVGLGVTVHVLGDVLTTNGAPLLWPVRFRAPRRVRRSLVLDDVWRPGGSFAVPLLGSTGSVREWLLATAVGLYATVGFTWSALDQMGFDTFGTYTRLSTTVHDAAANLSATFALAGW
ncbi:metal-dependent hydrolase [Cellulosimicrobium arenosum]|uniref:Metal-dependent hydrolase n=1 Tax=Cellulosimicrobium arenosum TaxID=2708133 RepID=A0A927IYS9_9MICO|nr:metal-dependent hydrolase [Cellulosimicrobium arenosum]MBD8077632.1 metal-dependent hydrolase [Cellulosimicrobium arenosum]